MTKSALHLSVVLNKGNEARVRRVRCVYLGNRRIAGAKPYVSEDLPFQDFEVAPVEVFDALGFTPYASDYLDTIAQAIRGKPARGEPPWEHLAEERRACWREDAQRVVRALRGDGPDETSVAEDQRG